MDNRLVADLLRLAEIYAAGMSLAMTTTSLYCTGSGATFARLSDGCDITVRRATRAVQWLSDHWPADLEWPSDIARPAPRRDAA